MGGYIGAKTGTLVASASDIRGDISATDTTPEITLKNTTETDADGTRSGKITFKGEQSGGEESVLAQIQGSHDGTADDEKGDLIFKTNDGNDASSPTERVRINSAGDVLVSSPDPSLTITNTTHEDTDGGRESTIVFKGEQSGGELSTLAEIEASHDGTADDEKGDLIFRTNDGSDGASPTEAMRIDSAQNIGIGDTAPDRRLHVNSGNTNECAKFESTDTEVTLEFTDTTGTSKIKSRADFRFETGSTPTERMRIDSSGNVGIGNSNPDQRLTIGDNSTATEIIQFKNTSNALVYFGDAADADVGYLNYNHGSNYFRIGVNAGEAIRIDSSRNLLVGRTAEGDSNAGVTLRPDGFMQSTRDGSLCGDMNRLSSDGAILRFQKDGNPVGTLGSVSGSYLFIGEPSAVGISFISDRVRPATDGINADNTYDFGHPTVRWDDIYATNGTIQTSDEREKQQIASLTDAEISAAKAISKLFKTFKWNDKVEAKGDAARTHTGVIAQQVETAMSDAGLDASKYAFWCSDTWWQVDGGEAYDTQEDAPEGATERNRKGIRYPELLSFIGAATEQRLTSIEARLDALEG